MNDATPSKTILAALTGARQATPPIWMMRQAGRYLPEYKATRAQAGDFLSLCYTPELAAEVTLQPIRRYGFDAAILFADILLIPDALGLDLWFVTGEGPRLSTVTDRDGLAKLKDADEIHGHLAPVYDTVRILARELPKETTLIGFAGARVIEQTIGEKLPEGFQRAEYLHEHGMIDRVTHRLNMKDDLVGIVRMLTKQSPPIKGDLPSPAAPVLEAAKG